MARLRKLVTAMALAAGAVLVVVGAAPRGPWDVVLAWLFASLLVSALLASTVPERKVPPPLPRAHRPRTPGEDPALAEWERRRASGRIPADVPLPVEPSKETSP